MIKKKHRILVISHGHPDFSLGGGEIAAYNLFKNYLNNRQVENAWFISRKNGKYGARGVIRRHNPNEYIWEQSTNDWFMMRAENYESLTSWFSDLISALRPTIIHTHHFVHLGLEYIKVIKNINPDIKILMTLHEYLAICANDGQMLKRNNLALCHRANFADCCNCFPDKTPEDFWLRKHFFTTAFEQVDKFIAPSNFLRNRFVEWGIEDQRIVTIENGHRPACKNLPRSIGKNEQRNRFGFFGQINPYKGLGSLLEAINKLDYSERKKLVLEIHGANLEFQGDEFQDEINKLIKPLIIEGTVEWHGKYQPHELSSRMANIDWVVIPSIWWENSPMVIQEAFSHGRPVIASNIGGMAEKVRHLVDGYHVNVRNSREFSRVIFACATNNQLWESLYKNISPPKSYDEIVTSHLSVINEI